jgi:hypothetical protein
MQYRLLAPAAAFAAHAGAPYTNVDHSNDMGMTPAILALRG